MILADNTIGMVKKQENTYIINLQASYIYKAMTEDIFDKEGKLLNEEKQYSTRDIGKDKLFTATIPYSLEMIRLDEYYPKEIYIHNKKQYTKSIINVNFDNDYFKLIEVENPKTKKKKKTKTGIIKKKKLRKYLYVNGFMLDGCKYIFYKRGASKARTGSCLFIKQDMYEKLMNRSRLIHKKPEKGLYIEPNEECDITSLNAYQSLILSGLEDIIEIDKESILIISDLESEPFPVTSSATYQENGELKTKNKSLMRVNNMTDGQGLLDESIFEKAERKDKGMMLLRSDLFKCCAFNTKIQEFFEDHKEWIVDGKVKDLYRGYVDYKKIKLITTPSSVKYLKFAYKFDSKEECYKSWFDNINNTFGIVKSDKQGNYGAWNRTTYQIINSMPFTKEDIRKLMQHELDYVQKMRTNLAFVKHHIAIKEKETIALETDMNKLDWDNEEDFKSEDECYKTSEMINNILSINSDFQYTKMFKQWRIDQINAYIKELRKGKIRLENTIYCTIVANPYEMLLHSLGKYNNVNLAKGTEVYCKFYDEGQELATFRNPHINSGNVMVSINKRHDEYKYFNFTDNILIINVSDNDFPDRGQGFDYDSDTLLLIPSYIFILRAKECLKYPTPLNQVKGDSKVRTNNPLELAELDNMLSNNFIGKIINKSQIINSYMWDCKKKGMQEDLIQKLYDTSSMLSSLSQIELDKAKKSFDNISMPNELSKINNINYNEQMIIGFEEEEAYEDVEDVNTGEVNRRLAKNKNGEQKYIKKMVVPLFFNYVARDNTYRTLKYFETPMDYLEQIIDESKSRSIRGNKKIGELLVKAKGLEGSRNVTEQHQKVFEIIKKCGKKINATKLAKCTLNEKGKQTVIKNAKKDAVEELSEIKLNSKTIYAILNKYFNTKEKEWSKFGMLALNLLYNSHQLKVLSIFKNTNNINEQVLIWDKNGDIDIFGEKYKLVKRSEIA